MGGASPLELTALRALGAQGASDHGQTPPTLSLTLGAVPFKIRSHGTHIFCVVQNIPGPVTDCTIHPSQPHPEHWTILSLGRARQQGLCAAHRAESQPANESTHRRKNTAPEEQARVPFPAGCRGKRPHPFHHKGLHAAQVPFSFTLSRLAVCGVPVGSAEIKAHRPQ